MLLLRYRSSFQLSCFYCADHCLNLSPITTRPKHHLDCRFQDVSTHPVISIDFHTMKSTLDHPKYGRKMSKVWSQKKSKNIYNQQSNRRKDIQLVVKQKKSNLLFSIRNSLFYIVMKPPTSSVFPDSVTKLRWTRAPGRCRACSYSSTVQAGSMPRVNLDVHAIDRQIARQLDS